MEVFWKRRATGDGSATTHAVLHKGTNRDSGERLEVAPLEWTARRALFTCPSAREKRPRPRTINRFTESRVAGCSANPIVRKSQRSSLERLNKSVARGLVTFEILVEVTYGIHVRVFKFLLGRIGTRTRTRSKTITKKESKLLYCTCCTLCMRLH